MPKKTFAQHPQKKQVSPMPRPHTNTVNSAIPSALAHRSPLQVDDDLDLDDICPVCESECTCRKKPSPPSTSSALTPTTSSSISSALSNAHPPSTAGKRPLKIKLTLPPNLKSRKPPETHSSSHSDARLGTAVQGAGPSSRNAAPAPRRRGRPPKVPATKQNARRKVAADDMEYKARGTTGTSAVVRKPYQPPVPVASTSSAGLSDSTLSDFPTFVPAASESTHSSSSESSDSSIDSDLDGEPFVLYNEGERHSTKLLPSHVGHKKRERIGGNRWEIKPRKKSVGAGEEEEEESSTESDQSSDDSPEDGDDENEEDEDEADVEADVEGDGGEMLADGDVDLDDGDEEMHGRIGVSFPGSGWSDDEESSFDADVFFANLDSDSGGSSPETHFAALRPFAHAGEREPSGAFSADEEDALLLMDIDPSVQLRRGHGEFEIGVDLDSLAFGWDGQLLFSHAGDGPNDGLGLSFSLGAADEDEEMAYVSGSEATVSWEDSGTGTVILQESDGDTTEDELVDSDGLPNPRAMMLFKWPSTISAINPLSTLSPSSFSDPPPNATPSTRIALASISAQRRSPPPTPSPADILAGRLYMNDLEDIDMEKLDKQRCTPRRRRGSGVPIMGEFTVEDSYTTRKTAVVAAGCEVPSFYRRVVRVPEPEPVEGTTPIEDTSIAAVVPTADSSEANPREPSQQSYASDSTTEAIDLDDVLDSSFLDPEPSMQDCETDIPDSLSQSSPMKPGTSPHLHNLSRWDRVPMATFRRTRESATASGVDATASDSGLHALQYHNGIGSMMGGMSLFTPPRPLGLDKMSRASARKKKGRHSYNSSPTLPPSRDGVLGSPFVPTAGPSQQGYTSKTKKELKKEKAMMKRKMTTKTSQQHRPYQPYRAHHHHHPNHKSRATNAVQRTGFSSGASSSIPSLTI